MKKLCAITLAAGTLLGCAPTRIRVANYKDAVIYVDGDYKGTGVAEIPRMGSKKPVTVTAKHNNQEVGSVKISRYSDAGTFVLGMFSYGVGFFICKKYPKEVIVPTIPPPPAVKQESASAWNAPPRDTDTLKTPDTRPVTAWDLPPKEPVERKKESSFNSNKDGSTPGRKVVLVGPDGAEKNAQAGKTSGSKTPASIWDMPPADKEPAKKDTATAKREEASFSDIFSEENTGLSFDSNNKIFVLDQETESRIQLFPKIKDFRSATIYKTSADSIFLKVQQEGKKMVVPLTKTNLEKIRSKVDLYLTR
jgi:hypothetical protein